MSNISPELEARFPSAWRGVPKAAVDYVAGQVKVEHGLLADYQWAGSTIEYHRSQIRKAPGFRESTRADEDALIEWLASDICPMVLTNEGLRPAMLSRCRNLKIEPPGRMERIERGCRARFERAFCERVTGCLSADSTAALGRPARSVHSSGRTPTCTAPSRSTWTPTWIWAWPPEVAGKIEPWWNSPTSNAVGLRAETRLSSGVAIL
ncbi:DUF4158 domain-containing protein [Acrocarpospora sp. B8E8]|uniref:DUF4158 domain-containing protein n=1 Tax=Acrocarpospora sp. B8E8 TaxID=3153572 RepID=UPI00325DEEE2